MGDAAPRCGACSATERLQLCPCFLVRYCGKKCQAAHWPTHGWECNRVRERAKAEAEGSETPGAGSTSSHGLTDESPASKGFRTPGKEPPPPQLAPYQAAVLSAAIERVCSANPAVVAGMCMDLLMRDVAHGLPIVTRALGANVFSPDLPPSSYWHPQRPAPPAAPVPPPGVFPGPFMMPPPFTMAYPPHPPAPAPAPRDRSGSAADQVEQLMARLAAASVQDASGQA
eukprot:TRINITY_DN27386_c0_g1_i1.p1 TRINITY_DN27386_c0_g1~~TRINITY_DN27386_c0_g1_i1.p1  ORF type:complete len:263 (+),score=72.37 TRINITY_DN27386_c0_g1_i1:108-791(+)